MIEYLLKVSRGYPLEHDHAADGSELYKPAQRRKLTELTHNVSKSDVNLTQTYLKQRTTNSSA